MDKNAREILEKHEEENKRSAMVKRMAEEESKRRDLNVEYWDGMQSQKSYRLPIGGKKWSELGAGGRVLFVLGIFAMVAVIGILIFTAIKAFSM